METQGSLRRARSTIPSFWGEEVSDPNVKEFPGNPTVFVAASKGIIEVTTPEHMRNANKPLIQILKEVCEESLEYAEKLYPKYNGPNGNWFPCGNAHIVLRWNTHRAIIKLFRKEATEKRGSGYYKGWFGSLMKTGSSGWWWSPPIKNSQSMKYAEEVCQSVRDKLIFANIKVNVETYID